MIKQSGFSLLELLIVLAMSSTVLFAVYQLFFHQQQQYIQQQALLQSQENSRLALQILKNNIETAGEAGCGTLANLIIHDHIAQNPRGIYEKDNKIYIEKAAYERTNLIEPMIDNFDPIYTHAEDLFAENDIVLISDCTYADLFKIKQIKTGAQGQIIDHNGLSRAYGANAQIMRWQVDSFYVTPHLYQKTILPDKPAIALVSDMDKWEIQYAVLAHNQPVFLSAKDITDWALVQGVIINHFNIVLYNAQK